MAYNNRHNNQSGSNNKHESNTGNYINIIKPASYSTINPAQAWSILKRHARDDMVSLRLQELCRDEDRVASLVAVHTFAHHYYNNINSSSSNTSQTQSKQQQQQHQQLYTSHSSSNTNSTSNRILMVDLSRQHLTNETLQHLLRLCKTRELHQYIQLLAWGPRERVLEQLAERQKAIKLQSHQHNQQYPYDNDDDDRDTVFGLPTMHLALRVPRYLTDACMFNAQGENVLTEMFATWDRLEQLVNSIRKGQYRGATGNMLKDVVVVGRGVAMEALKFIQGALLHDERAVTAAQAGMNEAATTRMLRRNFSHQAAPTRRLALLSSIDPVAAAQTVADLDPATTLIISIALQGNEETGMATRTLKSWLLQHLSSTVRKTDVILSRHMMLITANDLIAKVINKPESVHLLPETCRCEAWTSCTVATILPLGIVYGWPIVTDFLAGAHDIDQHFVSTNPRHNLPVLLAVADVWNDVFLKTSTRVVTPFSKVLSGYPSFVAALEAHACGTNSELVTSPPLVVAGDATHDRALYQGPVVNVELLLAMDTQVLFNTTIRHLQNTTVPTPALDDLLATQDAVLCACFAHADELALGPERLASANSSNDPSNWSSPTSNASVTSFDTFETYRTNATNTTIGNNYQYRNSNNTSNNSQYSQGNRPSIVTVCHKLDAFGCGQLIALAEHRALVKAHLWGLDPFSKETGSSVRLHRTENLRDELQDLFQTDESIRNNNTATTPPDIESTNLSTKTILEHYANMMQVQRQKETQEIQEPHQYFL